MQNTERKRCLCVYTWRHRASGKKLRFLLFAVFWLKILPQLNIKTVHNFKTKSSGIIFTPWDMFDINCAVYTILVSEVACAEQCARLVFL